MGKTKKTVYVTKEYVDKTVAELGGTLVEGINTIIKNMATKDDIKNMATKDDIKMLDGKIEDVKLEIRFMKDDIKGLTEELANTPSRSQFEEFKKEVKKSYLN